MTNTWYHLAYTLSDSEKRLDFYIDGKWKAFLSIVQVETEFVLFDNSSLYIGYDNSPLYGLMRYGTTS